VVLSARRAVEHATEAAAGGGQLPFTVRTLDVSGSAARAMGAELIATRPRYTTGTFLLGELYLGGPEGLTVVGADGSSRLRLRPGFELPVAPVRSVVGGRLRGASEPQLLVATGGAGLLLLEPGAGGEPTIRQMLPNDAEARDLTAVVALADGEVLLGTRRRGVLVYDGTRLTPFRFTVAGVNAAALEVTALAAVDSASFLIGTRDAGVFYVHAGVVDHADAGSGLPDSDVEAIALSRGSGTRRAYVGTPVGAAEFDLAAAAFRPVRTLADGLFSHALAVDGGELRVGTLDEGIREVALGDGGSLRRVSISAGAAKNSGQRVDAFVTAPDALYVLADGTLLRRDGAGWMPALPVEHAALTDANVSALAFAPDGTLYVGTFDHGMDLMGSGGEVRHIEDDHLFCINRLVVDPERHTMDAATADGLVLFDAQGRPRQTLTRRDGLISDHVTDVAFAGAATVLATPAGITFLGPAGAESLYAFQGLVSNHVYALAAAGSGQLLVGTLGGISILKANAVERNLTVTNSGLKHNWITALLPMPENAMLVGTYGAGVETLDGQGRFSAIELPAGAPRNLVINPNALYATASHVYAGTLGHGMLVYSVSAGRWSVVTEGLPSLNVTAFTARAGEIYVGTENGLVRMPEANLP
jgi:ligand-binding sensor domain-containing protein